MELPSHHVWQAEEYHCHSSAQKDAATELLKNIQFKGDEQILDVGCGDGKITANLTKYVPRGSVLGIDASSEMIQFAQKTFPLDRYSNLSFSVQDAQKLNYYEKFDVVFSSFALQWVPDISAFFKEAYKSLKPTGYLALTIPLGISEALEQAIRQVTLMPQWSSYFKGFSPGWHFRSTAEWKELIVQFRFMTIHEKVISQNVLFSSRKSFEGYVRPWFSYLKPLPDHLKQIFFEQIIDKYLEIEPQMGTGEVRFSFSRLDIVASKATP